MTGKAEKLMSDLFHQAAETYKAALESGVKAQEEVAQWWSKTLVEAGSTDEWQNRMRTFAANSVPLAEKNVEECLKLMQKNTETSMDLLHQAFETAKCESVADVQNKTRDLWESTLKAMRHNTEAVVKANTHAISAWADLMSQTNGKAKAAAAS
jgi:hypothetical protein